MKILKYLLFIIVGLVLLFVLMGVIKPTVNYGHEVTVDKPLKEAWAVHQDQSKLGDWLEGFKSIELLSGESGEVGSTYKVIVNPGEGQDDFEMTETLVSKTDFENIGMSFDSDVMLFNVDVSFSENDGKTTIKTDSKVNGKGFFMKSMFSFMGMFGSFQSQEVKNIEALKKVIEANTTDYYPPPVEVIEEASTIGEDAN